MASVADTAASTTNSTLAVLPPLLFVLLHLPDILSATAAAIVPAVAAVVTATPSPAATSSVPVVTAASATTTYSTITTTCTPAVAALAVRIPLQLAPDMRGMVVPQSMYPSIDC